MKLEQTNSLDKFNRSALFFSLRAGYDELSEALIAAGADVNIAHKDCSALMLAVEKGNNSIVNLLLEAGADVNRRNKDGDMALIYVAEKGSASLVNTLIQGVAAVNMIYQDDETVLMLVLIMGRTQCVLPLIEAGAHVNAKNRRGETALSYALRGRNDDCIRLMIGAGADSHGYQMLQDIVAKENQGSFMQYGIDFDVKSLLRAGAEVDTSEGNLLASCLKSRRRYKRRKELAMLLFAAGEKLKTNENSVPDYLEPPDEGIYLKDLCREAIRQHLLELSNVNLFFKVAKLGLPPTLSKYLLYEQSVTE